MLGQSRTQPFEVAQLERDGAASGRAVRGVREAHEALAPVRLEQLDERREAPVAGALLQGELLDGVCIAPRCRDLFVVAIPGNVRGKTSRV